MSRLTKEKKATISRRRERKQGRAKRREKRKLSRQRRQQELRARARIDANMFRNERDHELPDYHYLLESNHRVGYKTGHWLESWGRYMGYNSRLWHVPSYSYEGSAEWVLSLDSIV